MVLPVQAGDYTLTRIETADGETYTSTDNPTTRPWYPNSIGSASAMAQGNGSDLVTISARSSGQVRAVFTWQPAFTGDVPANDYVLKVKISPMAYLGFNGDTLLATEINDGFGDSPVAYVSQGAHLVSVPTHGQTEVKTPFITLTSKGTVQGYDSLWVGGYLSYSAEKDTREVKLHRAGARGEVESILPDGTNVTTGHTRWSYYERVPDEVWLTYEDQPVWLSTVIGATPSGQWSPYTNLTGVWSPSDLRDRKPPTEEDASHVQNLPNGGALLDNIGINNEICRPKGWYFESTEKKSVNNSFPQNSVTVNYSLTDNADGATAKAQYVLTLHDEWENPSVDDGYQWPDGTHSGQSYRTESKDLNVPRIDGPQTNKTWTFADVTVGLTSELTTTFGLSFNLNDWLNGGVTFENTAKLEISSSYQATAPDLDLTAGWSALPCVNYIIRTEHKLFDHYDVFGKVPNSCRADEKWEQSADLPVPIQDISPNWRKFQTGQPIG